MKATSEAGEEGIQRDGSCNRQKCPRLILHIHLVQNHLGPPHFAAGGASGDTTVSRKAMMLKGPISCFLGFGKKVS